MKVLIAVPSCHSLRHYEQSIRDTWGLDITPEIDLRFFLGNPHSTLRADEVHLDTGDSLQDLTHKVVEMFKWALQQRYTHALKSDLDTLVRPKLLKSSGFEQYDWTGGANSFFASGGGGYCLSQRAMRAVVEHEIEPGPAEDVNTAHALLAQGITLHADYRFKFCPGAVLDQNTITYHLSSVKGWSAKASPEEMYQAHSGTFTIPQNVVPSRQLRFRRSR